MKKKSGDKGLFFCMFLLINRVAGFFYTVKPEVGNNER